MRLIDADELQKVFEDMANDKWNKETHTSWSRAFEESADILDECKTIEAEPVVRCKDCKFNYANQMPSGDECQLCVELPISKDFYCAYGEKTDEVEDENN